MPVCACHTESAQGMETRFPVGLACCGCLVPMGGDRGATGKEKGELNRLPFQMCVVAS